MARSGWTEVGPSAAARPGPLGLGPGWPLLVAAGSSAFTVGLQGAARCPLGVAREFLGELVGSLGRPGYPGQVAGVVDERGDAAQGP
jgi:hypothetical protein